MKILLCLILLPVSAFAQTKPVVPPCKVTIDKVPLIRGLRLGQPYQHLNEALPRRYDLDAEPDELGLRRVILSKVLLSSPEKLSGVSTVSLIYFDDSLVSLEIHYTDDIRWPSNLHFVAAIAQQLNLPREGWVERDPSYLLCQGFIVEVRSATILPTLKMWDITFADEAVKRKAALEERKRARFKP